jgi:hypothetical protein
MLSGRTKTGRLTKHRGFKIGSDPIAVIQSGILNVLCAAGAIIVVRCSVGKDNPQEVSRSTNSVFSRLHLLGIISINISKDHVQNPIPFTSIEARKLQALTA